MSRIAAAATLYVAIVFAVGFVFGVVRVSLLVPRLGQRWSELAEAPLMCAAIVLAARYLVRHRLADAGAAACLAVGLLAIALMLATEFTVVLWLRGLTLAEWYAGRDPVAGAVYAALLLFFALAPALARRR